MSPGVLGGPAHPPGGPSQPGRRERMIPPGKPDSTSVDSEAHPATDLATDHPGPLPAVGPKKGPSAKPHLSPALTKDKPRYMPYGDAARVLGTVAVVLGHVCDMSLFRWDQSEADWWFACLIDASCRWAVPVYIMLSGSLLLDPARAEAPTVFYSKRLARLGIPIVFWTAFFMLFSVYWTGWTTPEEAWRNLALGKPYSHLHFIFRVAGLYVFTPMLRVWLGYASRSTVALTVALLLGLSAFNSIAEGFMEGELTMFLRFFPFLGYYLLGYLLRDHRISKRTMLAAAALFAASVLILAAGTALLLRLDAPVNLANPQAPYLKGFPSIGFLLFDFLNPVRIVMAICAWVLLIHIFDEGWLNAPWGRFTSRWLAPATLGLYLVHPFFRDLLYCEPLNGFTRDLPLYLRIPAVTAVVYAASLLFTLIVMRTPLVKKIVI